MNHPNSKEISNGILRALSIIIGVCALLFFLYKISSVLIYLAIAGVVSLIGRPIIRFLRNKLKFKNTLAVVVTMVLMLGFLFGIASMFVPLIESQGKSLALLDYTELESSIKDLAEQINIYFAERNINLLEEFQNSDILSKLNLEAIPDLLETVLGMVGSLSIGLFSVLFISFFFLKDSKLLTDGIMLFVPDNKEGRLKKSFDTIKNLLSRYFIGLLMQVSILFILYLLTLLIFGIENALVIAFLCALLNLIPYVGPLIGGLLMFVLTMTGSLGEEVNVIIRTTSLVMVCYLCYQLLDNFVLQPKIFSTSVKSHPLEIFLVIVIAGLLFGVLGMIVAVPGYTAIKVIAKEFIKGNKLVESVTKNL